MIENAANYLGFNYLVDHTIGMIMSEMHNYQLISSEGRESWSRLGLETEGTKTLGLVSVSSCLLQFYSVSSRSCPDLDL